MINQITNAIGTGLDQLMNLVPLPGRVTILPVEQYAPVPIPAGSPFVAMFNPENWVQNESYEYEEVITDGDNAGKQVFKYVKSPTLSFELLLDGTGASGEKKEVTALVQSLRQTVGFNGNKHRPNKLFVIWGYFIFHGVLESMDVTYTLFRANGTPLRARVALGFREDTDEVTQVLEADLQSADLTHVRTMREGERLERVTHAIYGTSRHHLSVAAANGLTTFRQDFTGRTLQFPPVEK